MEKKKYKVIKPLGFDGRKEVGEIIELTDEEAKAFNEDYIEPVAETASVAGEAKVEAGSGEQKEESENQESEKSDS